MKPVLAKFYYEAGKDADSRSSYKELPEILQGLCEALDIKVQIPTKIGWGGFGSFCSQLKKHLKQIDIEILLQCFRQYFHVNFFPDRIDIKGRDLMDGINKTIYCKTGFEEIITIGYDVPGLQNLSDIA